MSSFRRLPLASLTSPRICAAKVRSPLHSYTFPRYVDTVRGAHVDGGLWLNPARLGHRSALRNTLRNGPGADRASSLFGTWLRRLLLSPLFLGAFTTPIGPVLGLSVSWFLGHGNGRVHHRFDD